MCHYRMDDKTKYYLIEIDLTDPETAIVDDWDFTLWPNQPKTEIIENSNGTFSVKMDENFVPLIDQLNSLFVKENNLPDDNTYIGNPILKGKCKPADIIYSGFINNEKGMIISLKFLNILKSSQTPNYKLYSLRLKKGRKEFNDYFYISFLDNSIEDLDFKFVKRKSRFELVVSETAKNRLQENQVSGLLFTEV